MRKAQDYTVALGISFCVLLVSLLAMISTPAYAGADCTQRDTQLLGLPTGGILTSEDCNRFDDARKKADQSGANAAALDVYGLKEGFNLTGNYANSNFNEDGHAIGLNLSYQAPENIFGGDAWVKGMSFSLGGATGTNWDDQMVKVGGTINFGSF